MTSGAAYFLRVARARMRSRESTGLLRRPPRSASNYRLYREEDVYRVRFIKAAQATGFTVDPVRTVLTVPP